MPLVTFRRSDRLGDIVIDSPPLNLFSGGLLADSREAVGEAADSDIRALLLRAEGADFSAGADVSVYIGLDETQAAAHSEIRGMVRPASA
jgi:enoyl-CoA hydratase/carnithine racemase